MSCPSGLHGNVWCTCPAPRLFLKKHKYLDKKAKDKSEDL